MPAPHSEARLSTAERNALTARRLWEAASLGDAKPLRELMSPDVRWHGSGAHALAGNAFGIEAVLDLLASAGENVDDLRSEILDIFASGRGAVVHYRVHARRGPKKLDSEFVMIERIQRGRVTDVTTVPTDPQATAAFWSLQ